jgi:hypothetical protein
MPSLQPGSLQKQASTLRKICPGTSLPTSPRLPIQVAPKILTKTLCGLYAFLMIKRLVSISVCLSRIAMQSATAKEAEMLAVTFIVSCLSVCGFYVYVVVQPRREQKREDAHKKRLPEHLYEMEPEPRQGDAENARIPIF